MSFDPHTNFAYSTVATAPSPASSGTSLVLTATDGALFPQPSSAGAFNLTVWPAGTAPISTNAEIVRCTARSADTLTIVRAQEGSGARSILVGDQIALTITAKIATDIEQSRPRLAQGTTYVPSTNVAATDTAAIQAAHDALPSTGGTILLDAGPYAITAGTIAFTKPIHLVGSGPNGSNASTGAFFNGIGTLLTCSSSTGIALQVDADGCTFEKLHLQNTSVSAPTAGSAIKVASNGKSCRYIDCCIEGFYVGLNVEKGYYWKVDRCSFIDPVLYGIRIQDIGLVDGGDQTITNSDFTAGPNNLTPTAGIQWESGGGPKIIGCKVNITGSASFTVGFNFQISDGATTSVAVVSSCSIENVTYGVLFQLSGVSNTGHFGKIVVIGNEFFGVSGTSYGFAFAPSVASRIDRIVCTGNIGSAATSLILLHNVDLVLMSNNISFSSPATYTFQGGETNLVITGDAFSTSGRPAPGKFATGAWYYDTTLHKPGFSDGGSNWRDAAGTVI